MMSCTLYWKPVAQDDNRVGEIQLRNILEKKYGYPQKLDCCDLPYLLALKDAEVEGVEELIEAIEKYDEIEIFLKC